MHNDFIRYTSLDCDLYYYHKKKYHQYNYQYMISDNVLFFYSFFSHKCDKINILIMAAYDTTIYYNSFMLGPYNNDER